MSNSPELLDKLPETERAESCRHLESNNIPCQRTLDVFWNAEEDTFAIIARSRLATLPAIFVAGKPSLQLVASATFPRRDQIVIFQATTVVQLRSINLYEVAAFVFAFDEVLL